MVYNERKKIVGMLDLPDSKGEKRLESDLDLTTKNVEMALKKEQIKRRLESKNISLVKTAPVEVNFVHSIKKALQKSLSVYSKKEHIRDEREYGLTTKMGDSEFDLNDGMTLFKSENGIDN